MQWRMILGIIRRTDMKKILSDFRIAKHQKTEEGRMYLRYNEVVGGDLIGLCAPSGTPRGVDERGGRIKVYEECIQKGITWEELIGYDPCPQGAVI